MVDEVPATSPAASLPLPPDPEQLLAAYRSLVYGHAQRYARRAAAVGLDVEDLAQEGRLALLEAATTHDPERAGGSFIGYASQRVGWKIRRAIIRARPAGCRGSRQLPRLVSLAAPVGLEDGLAERLPAPAKSYVAADLDELLAAVDMLPAAERVTVQLRFGLLDGEDWSAAEIAAGCQVSGVTVRQRLARGVARLRGLLGEDGAEAWRIEA